MPETNYQIDASDLLAELQKDTGHAPPPKNPDSPTKETEPGSLGNDGTKRPCGCGARGRHRSGCPAATGEGQPSGPAKSKSKPVSEEELKAGVEVFVKAIWGLIGIITSIFGRPLDDMSGEDKSELEQSAMVWARKIPFLTAIAAFLGFPVVLIRKVGKRMRKPEDATKVKHETPKPPPVQVRVEPPAIKKNYEQPEGIVQGAALPEPVKG